MEITLLIAAHIREVFEGNNWTDISIADTVKDLSFEEAITVTPASSNTIAALLYHIKFYNEVVMQRLNGIAPEINDANGFDMPELKNETEWKKLVAEAHHSFVKLSGAVENFPEERLNETTPNGVSSYYKTLHGVTEHAYYHLGQMVILKNLIRR
jgi:uncharacterized damage-inducible protein DinB